MSAFVCLGVGVLGFLVYGFVCWRGGKRVAWRRLAQASPKCLHCGYDLKGLTEARCPECGAAYTLDELWLAQRDQPHDP